LLTRTHSVVVHLSVFHATLPRINSLIVDFSTGQIDLRLADRDIELMDNSRSGNSKDRSGNFKNIKLNDSQNQNSGIRSPKFKEKEKMPSPTPTKWHADRESSEDVQTTVCFGKRESDMASRDFSGDADETGSQSSLSRNAVYQTVEFRWEEEYKARKSKS
jgi:hypothetical protein